MKYWYHGDRIKHERNMKIKTVFIQLWRRKLSSCSKAKKKSAFESEGCLRARVTRRFAGKRKKTEVFPSTAGCHYGANLQQETDFKAPSSNGRVSNSSTHFQWIQVCESIGKAQARSSLDLILTFPKKENKTVPGLLPLVISVRNQTFL